MNPWGSPDRYFAITDAARRRADAEDLVEEMVHALATAGEYRTTIDLQSAQRVVDFNWAAHQAARRVGIRIQIERTIFKADNTAELRVARHEGLN